MAFMMPIVKNGYSIYPGCPSSRGPSRGPSRNSSTPQSRGSSLSSSPNSTVASFMSSPRSSYTPAISSPKSGSQTSLHKFHSKLLDRLRNTFRGKGEKGDADSIGDLSRRSSTVPA